MALTPVQRARLRRFRAVCRRVERAARLKARHRGARRPVRVRAMAAGDARREGFAYYTPATGTVHVNPCALTRLREADWYVLAIHEVVGHHLHPRDYGRAAGERCALECESAWARHWGVEAEAAEWRAYREARAALDRTVDRTRGWAAAPNRAAARRAFARVPRRMVRVSVELRRVLESPGAVREYLEGPLDGRCACRRR